MPEMQPTLAVLIVVVAALVVACLDLLERGQSDAADCRSALRRIGGTIVIAGVLVLGADWLTEHAVRSFGEAAASSDWITASAAVAEQLLRLVFGGAA